VVEGDENGGWDDGREWLVKPWADKVATAVQTWLARWHRCSDCVADGWAHMVLYFPKLFKSAQTWKLKMDALPYSKNSQFLHVDRLGHYEQFSQLFRHPIINRIRVKSPGIDSTFESLMNFKRNLNLLKKSDKFSKIPS
jgi:hypothetical protein